jgi:D-alanyl-D-alanine endopeptidase (penicillin-binding protein 7)
MQWRLGVAMGLVVLLGLVVLPAVAVPAAAQPAVTAGGGQGASPARAKPRVTAQAAPRRVSAQQRPAAAPVRRAQAAPAPRPRPATARSARAVQPAVRADRVQQAALRPSARPSYGERLGLRDTPDPLDLRSSVVLVVDQDTDEVLFSKNALAVLPVASITKLMTALVVVEAGQPLDEVLTITHADVDTEKGTGSRLSLGTQLTRGEALHLALMSSENRAANALGRYYPGGMRAFVEAMNAKAALLGMHDSRFVEPTGLSSRNQASARDLALLVHAAYGHELIRALSVSPGRQLEAGARELQFRNSNRLVGNPLWSIGLQKTGFISEAGRSVVMQTDMAGRRLIMVLLDAADRYTRIADAERLRRWLSGEGHEMAAAPTRP